MLLAQVLNTLANRFPVVFQTNAGERLSVLGRVNRLGVKPSTQSTQPEPSLRG